MNRPLVLLTSFLLTSSLLWLACACSKEPTAAKQGSPQRIVSLTPSNTAILEELGLLDMLVGRDRFSTMPESILPLPIVGDFATPNVEAIVALAPDLVLLDASQNKTKRALDTLGVTSLSLTMHELSDVGEGLRKVGEAVGETQRADDLVTVLGSSLSEIANRAKKRTHQPKVLVVIDRAPDSLRNMVAAGPGSYLDELLTMVGGINMMASSSMLYPQLGAEQILRGAPDIIIDISHAPGGARAYDLIAEVPAVAAHRVHITKDPNLRAPSPKAALALEHLFELTEL